MMIGFNNKIKYSLKMAIRLSLQRALIGEISSNLRMVAFEVNEDEKNIYIFFYFNGKISDDDFDSTNCISGEVSGDFDPETKIIEKSIRIDFPNDLPPHDYIVYKRKEFD